jgi:flavodoxin
MKTGFNALSTAGKVGVIASAFLGIGGLAFFLFYVKAQKKNSNQNSVNTNQTVQTVVDKSKNYIIGDSQTPFIDKNSQKAKRIGETGGKANLWEGGKSLSWLKQAVDEYPTQSLDVNAIIINIGTNGGFNANEDIQGLISSIKNKFPNAKLYAVKGSWGWGGNKNVTQQKVDTYYNKFQELGVTLIPTAIGVTSNPHNNLPVYATIGAEIDQMI